MEEIGLKKTTAKDSKDGGKEGEESRDLYVEYKKLQQQLALLQVQEDYIKVPDVVGKWQCSLRAPSAPTSLCRTR